MITKIVIENFKRYDRQKLTLDDAAGRYRGLQDGRQVWLDDESPMGLLTT